jgi:RimJ/RimL family protein N-acetyltransferase
MESQRLRFIPFTLELMQSLLEDRQAFKEMVTIMVPDSWPGPDTEEALPFLISIAKSDPEGAWTRIIVHKGSATAIGIIGFKGLPDEEGIIEVGYSIIPERRGEGYATEAAATICEWALEQPGVRSVTAETLPDNLPSQRVLEKAGFSLAKESGEMLYFEKRG